MSCARIDWQTERRLTEVQDKGGEGRGSTYNVQRATHACIHCVQQRMILCQSPTAAAVYVLAVLNVVAAVFCRILEDRRRRLSPSLCAYNNGTLYSVYQTTVDETC